MRKIAFVLAATDLGTMIVNRFDEATYPNGALFGVGHQILEYGAYDSDTASTIVSLLRARRQVYGDGVVALDGGANIGALTLVMAREMCGWGHVISVEPQSRIFYALAGNVALNNLFNVQCMNVALGCASGTIDVPLLDYEEYASFGSLELKKREQNENIGQEVNYENTDEVEMVAIDHMPIKRLDLLKLDVEGMEEDALLGAYTTIEYQRPILFVEHIKSDKQKLVDVIEGHGYRIKQLGMNLLAIHCADPVLACLG